MNELLAQFELEYPSRLAFLMLVGVLALMLFRSGWDASSLKRWLLLAVRAAICALLVIGLASPVTNSVSTQHELIGVRDISDSMHPLSSSVGDELKSALAKQSAAVSIDFASTPRVDDAVDTSGSDPARAILAAVANQPKDAIPHVMVVTDARQTRGDLLAAAEGAGVPLVFMPPTSTTTEFSIEGVEFPAEARPHETISISVRVKATANGVGELSLYDADKLVEKRRVSLTAGDRSFLFTTPAAARRRADFRAALSGFSDTFDQNNEFRATWLSAPPAAVALVSKQPAELARHQQILEQAGFRVARPTPAQIPDAATLSKWDLVVLMDVAEADLPGHAGATLREFVRGGGGLLAVGGEAVFGGDKFAGGTLEQLLPVSVATVATEKKSANLAMVLIIDQSESMLIEDNPGSTQGTRLKLAKEAGKSTVKLLDPNDRIGVLAFGTTTEWVSEIAPSGDKKALLSRLDTLKAKGETNMFPALEKSYLALEQIDSEYKHIILITDGISSPGDFDDVAKRMAAAGITVATVSVSSGAEQTVLMDVADIAGGRHYHCEDPKDLPTILTREARTAVAAVGEAEVTAFELRPLPGVDVGGAPSLTSYAATTPKPDAELSLLAGEGDPLLAFGELGGGRTAVLTCDRKGLDKAWNGWSGYGNFWRRLTAQMVRGLRRSRMSLKAEAVSDSELLVRVDVFGADGGRLNDADVRLQVTRQGAASAAQQQMRQSAAGQYQATLPIQGQSSIELRAMLADQSQQVSSVFTPNYGVEWRTSGVDLALLEDAAAASGGRVATSIEDALQADDRTRPRRDTHWPPLLIAAACLLVVDAALRRLMR